MIWWFIGAVCASGVVMIGVALWQRAQDRKRVKTFMYELRQPAVRASTMRPPAIKTSAEAVGSDYQGSELRQALCLPAGYTEETWARLLEAQREGRRVQEERLKLPRDPAVADLFAPQLESVAITAITAPEGAENDNDDERKERA